MNDYTEHFTLKKLINEIKKCATALEDPKVCFGFGGLFPTDFHSWRGDYNELAIDYAVNSHSFRAVKKPPTVKEFLEMCYEALDGTYYGYKGGEYKMTGETRAWV